MHLDSVLAIAGVVLVAAGIYVPARISIRNDRATRIREAEKDRQEAIDKAVAAAVAPIAHDLQVMAEDRNYQRGLADQRQQRIDQLSDQLGRR